MVSVPQALRQPHVFISFKSGERSTAALLKNSLEEGGFSVWWQESIQCGREWHGEIDQAILSAGCVVVLWSPASLVSPWVRHEASQAVARGIYTPVRLVPMVIGSPFDRIQATDLFDWDGSSGHPGLQRLLHRVDQLIPRRLTRIQRLGRFFVRNRIAILSAVIAGTAIAMLIRLSMGLEKQLAVQAEIAESVQRTLQPLSDFNVSAFVSVDPATPGFQEYIKFLEQSLHVSEKKLPADVQLPPGVHVSRTTAAGQVEAISIQAESRLWPVDTGVSWMGTIVRYTGLKLSFKLPQQIAAVRPPDEQEPPDLKFTVSSDDYDGSERGQRRNNVVEWNLSTNELVVHFTDVASKASWESNGNIASVPDLERATMFAAIDGTMYSSTKNSRDMAGVDAGRRGLKLNALFLDYSGRKVMIRGSAMVKSEGAKGLPVYSGALPVIMQKL